MDHPNFSRLRNPDLLDDRELDFLGLFPLPADVGHAAARTFPAKPEAYRTAFHRLRRYARARAVALRLRERGFEVTAEDYERECRRIYDSLPAFARWNDYPPIGVGPLSP